MFQSLPIQYDDVLLTLCCTNSSPTTFFPTQAVDQSIIDWATGECELDKPIEENTRKCGTFLNLTPPQLREKHKSGDLRSEYAVCHIVVQDPQDSDGEELDEIVYGITGTLSATFTAHGE